MTARVTKLAFKPPRPVRGKLQTIATFTLAGLVEIRGLIVEDHTGAACFLWPSVPTRGGHRVKIVKLVDIARRDAVEKTILTEYQRQRVAGNLPGETFPLPQGATDPGPLDWPQYMAGLRRGDDWHDGFERLSERNKLRVCTAVLWLSHPRAGNIHPRDAELVGLLYCQVFNRELVNQRKRESRAARRARG